MKAFTLLNVLKMRPASRFMSNSTDRQAEYIIFKHPVAARKNDVLFIFSLHATLFLYK
jgi:hypothetical protein